MHGMNSVKFISAQQARDIYQCENIRETVCNWHRDSLMMIPQGSKH